MRLVEQRAHEGDLRGLLTLTEARMLDEAALRLRFARMMTALLPGVVAEMILAGRQPDKMTKGEILAFLTANAAWLGPV